MSTRPGPVGAGVTRVRAAVLRLLAPSLGELLAQLERDRHRMHGEITALRRRVSALEAAAAGGVPGDAPPVGRGPAGPPGDA